MAEVLGGVVGATAPLVAGLFVLLGGIFGSNEKRLGGLPMLVLAALACAAAHVWAPDTGFWTSVERVAWWGGGILAGLGAVFAFNQTGGATRGALCALFVPLIVFLAVYVPSTPEVRLDLVRRQLTELERQVETEIPELIARQAEEVRDVRSELGSEGLSAVRKAELEDEAHEIVRFILALERHRDRSGESLSRLRSLERTLERQASAQELLGGDAAVIEQYDEISREAGSLLAVELDTTIGSGAIADAQVDERYRALVGE